MLLLVELKILVDPIDLVTFVYWFRIRHTSHGVCVPERHHRKSRLQGEGREDQGVRPAGREVSILLYFQTNHTKCLLDLMIQQQGKLCCQYVLTDRFDPCQAVTVKMIRHIQTYNFTS
jgi:hypothetical protein